MYLEMVVRCSGMLDQMNVTGLKLILIVVCRSITEGRYFKSSIQVSIAQSTRNPLQHFHAAVHPAKKVFVRLTYIQQLDLWRNG